MSKLYYHEKTPVSLNAVLLTDPYFAKHWKIIPTVVKVLNQILKWNQVDESKGGQSDITWKWFIDRFDADYTTVIHSLESLELLGVERAGRGQKGLKCFAYRLTEKCLPLLADSNREYLYRLLTDKTTKRKLQKSISKRGYRKKVYGDVRDEIKATIDGITFKQEEINSLCESYPPETTAFVRLVISEIVEKTYGDLQHSEADNRVSNPYTLLPAEVKSLIEVNGLRYITTFDIRSAYPSMWAHWIQHLNPENSEIAAEKAAYEKIFLNPAVDPKQHLSEALGISRSEIKDVMISYFNGKGFRNNVFVQKGSKNPFVKFNSWLKSNFPKLYTLWSQTEIKQTGNQIGKNFETKLMLDESIFQKARSLGLVIGYENDGFSVYGNIAKDNPCVRELLDFVSEQSVRLLGIKLVIVPKPTPKIDPTAIMIERYEERVETLYKNWKAFTQRYYRLPPEKRDGGEFQKRKDDWIEAGNKCFEVLKRLGREYGTQNTPP